jgi:parallel beta-helix repeat protein
VKIVAARGRGIVFDGKGVGWSADRNIVRNCVIDGVQSDGIELLASSSNLIEGCRITNTAGHGIQITKSSSIASTPNKPSSDNQLIGNVVDESGQDGINLNSGSRNEIRDNTVTNSSDVTSKRDGIRLQSTDNIPCDDNVIAGNTATDTQSARTQRYGLYISSALCRRTVVSGNRFSGNASGDLRDLGTGTLIDTPDDTTAPSVPTIVRAAATAPQSAEIEWSAASDDVGVKEYVVRRDAAVVTTVAAPGLTYADAGLTPGTTYAYTVEAVDGAGNASGPSAEASVTTPASHTLEFAPVADTYVDAATPTTPRGTSSQLRVDGSPDLRAYLRFDVQGVTGTVESARLRLWANSSSSVGHRVHAVDDTTWSEGMLYADAPPLGAVVGSSGSFASGGYREVDVTALLTEDGLLSLGVSTANSTAISYGSRESSNDPQLVVVLVDD